MGTDQEKIANRARMWGLVVFSMTAGIWDMVEESSVSLSPIIGEQLLKMAEKQLGLEIAGESPEHIMVELGRIFVDEYGFCSSAQTDVSGNTIKVVLAHAVGVPEFKLLMDMGVEKPFSHPFMCAGLAALARLGRRARPTLELDVTNQTYTITFEMLS